MLFKTPVENKTASMNNQLGVIICGMRETIFDLHSFVERGGQRTVKIDYVLKTYLVMAYNTQFIKLMNSIFIQCKAST